ncbi:hypothetical protein Tco_1528713, partial [Tanacetum coccineum]
MTTMAEYVIAARADNRPPMLDKSQYNSWQSRMLLYIKGKEHDKEKNHEACDIKATNIVLQGLSPDVYSLVNSSFSCQGDLGQKKEMIHSYYLRFAQLINDMNTIGMTMKPLQVNTKFVNHLQPEWSKFVTDVKLARDMHKTNFDKLYAYLRQHEAHANEVRLMRQRFPGPIALVVNSYDSPSSYTNHSQYHQQLSPVAQQFYSPPSHQQALVVHHKSYQAPAIHQESQASLPQLDSGL